MSLEEDDKKEYDESVAYLYSLQKFGIKFGLDNTIRLLTILGDPQKSFRSIHIAGTNGKGSTSAMLESILRAAGFSVGLFTSPHLVSFTERIRVNGVEIEEGEVVRLTKAIRDKIGSYEPSGMSREEFLPTFFEFVTAMAFMYFREKGIDWAVVETGMGGRLDATNVIVPQVSVITRIGYDHKEYLGGSLREIAGEKAGIIKDKVPVVSASQEDEALDVITRKASEKGTDVFVYGRDFHSRASDLDMQGVKFDYEGKERLRDLRVPLAGKHQVENASVAAKTAELVLKDSGFWNLAVRYGLAKTRWQGRMELIQTEGCVYDILLDGAHNPSAARALAGSLMAQFAPFYDKVILIFGIMADKDAEGIMAPLLPLASEVIVTAPDYERAAAPGSLAGHTGSVPVTAVKSVKEAIDLAIRKSSGGVRKTLMVITGSFYTIGEAKTYLGKGCSCPSLSGLR